MPGTRGTCIKDPHDGVHVPGTVYVLWDGGDAVIPWTVQISDVAFLDRAGTWEPRHE
jgi:hypothetical protein